MRINLTDNNIGRPDEGLYPGQDIAALYPIANKSIAQLCQENSRLLIFPHSIESSDDRIDQLPIFSLTPTDTPTHVRITTGNVMGFIGLGDLQIKIQSRFDKGRDDYLLHYMLQKVLSLNLFDLHHNNDDEEVFDFLLFLFPYLLKEALRQGIYREYRRRPHNDAHLKGAIDISRHLAQNLPFVGNMAYTTREYSSDNSMTELVRHTIEFIRTMQYGQALLNIDRETKENIATIVALTPSYSRGERSSVVSKNLRLQVHPYYTAYRPLQALCLQILRMEEAKYGEHTDELCGILFDGAWLWEEYVDTILRSYGFTHPRNKARKGAISLFADGTGWRYPDFYRDDIVLDAKYKQLGNYERVSEVARDDVHQLIAYLNPLHAIHGGFVAPVEHARQSPPTAKLKGHPATLAIYGIEICRTASSYADFCEQMTRAEQAFVSSLLSHAAGK